MNATILEQKRANHEEIERLEHAIINVLEQVGTDGNNIDNYKIDMVQSHAVNYYLERIQQIGMEILPSLYEDKDKTGNEEIMSITGPSPQIYSVFYERLKEIRRFHSQYLNLQPQDALETVEIKNIESVVPSFSGEEGFGKCLDLHQFYNIFINLRPENHIKYNQYLDKFYKFLETKHPRTKEYKQYLIELRDYLIGFLKRSKPLSNIQAQIDEIDEKWKKGDNLNPLYCRSCDKLFANQNVFNGHLTGKKHKNALKNANTVSLEIRELEYKISELCNQFLQETILNTKSTIEMKFSRTIGEIMKALESEEKNSDLKSVIVGTQEEEDDDFPEIKTTKDNYPVGWDGKPIPYWLYKLHGLGVEYKCEICGNHSYWGRKNFEAHFQEARHARGMKVLGIPNTKHFHNITIINEAIALWQKMQRDSHTKYFQPENEEEYEDSEGNVYKKKVYEDLKRQGLV